MELNRILEIISGLKEGIGKVIVGQKHVVDLLVNALVAQGHVLLEGVPGTGKTLLMKTLALLIRSDFKRVQFTPDLMPSDIVGTKVFNIKTSEFVLVHGPIFTNLLLADEVNRSPAKTQSALLEAMGENQVTIEGERTQLDDLFMVIATQNPIEFEGTYPLPEAQLDRFMHKILVPYPNLEEETNILGQLEAGFRASELSGAGLTPVATREEVLEIRKAVKTVTTKKTLISYIVQIIHATRSTPQIAIGAGPRGSISLALASKAEALIQGRDFVMPDDIKKMAFSILRHRIVLKPEAEIEGLTPDGVLEVILNQIRVPR